MHITDNASSRSSLVNSFSSHQPLVPATAASSGRTMASPPQTPPHLRIDPTYTSSPPRTPGISDSPLTPDLSLSTESPNMSTSTSRATIRERERDNVSLTINYLPSKFSPSLLSPGARRRRKGKGDGAGIRVPKMGGGVDAFRRGEPRMGEDEDEGWVGDDGEGEGGGKDGSVGVAGKGKGKMRWTRFKWILFIANFILTAYSITTLILLLLTWFSIFTHSSILQLGNKPELVLSTISAFLALFTSLLGWAGILLNNRSFLAVYTFLLWVVFVLLCAPGYITYKKRTFNLEGKVNAQWSRALGAAGRLQIQNELGCCGYFSPFVEATISQTCYSRSTLPGCKAPYIKYQKDVLQTWYTVAFALVPVQMAVMLAGLLCANHVTYRFGKGMMPKAYRLSLGSMAVIMDNYASQLAEQYGTDFASEILSRSRSNLQLADSTVVLPTLKSADPALHTHPRKYDSSSGKYEGVSSADTTLLSLEGPLRNGKHESGGSLGKYQ